MHHHPWAGRNIGNAVLGKGLRGLDLMRQSRAVLLMQRALVADYGVACE
jgi:hypothetical protein